MDASMIDHFNNDIIFNLLRNSFENLNVCWLRSIRIPQVISLIDQYFGNYSKELLVDGWVDGQKERCKRISDIVTIKVYKWKVYVMVRHWSTQNHKTIVKNNKCKIASLQSLSRPQISRWNCNYPTSLKNGRWLVTTKLSIY